HQYGDDGRAHAGLAGAFGSDSDDFGVGFANCAGERVGAVGKPLYRVAYAGILPFSRLAEIVEHHVDTDLAGHLTGSLSAHAIANHKNAELGVVPEIVFVIGADAAYVALARHLNA